MRPAVSEPLKRFVWDIQSMVELAEGEREILLIGADLMRRLVAERGFLPDGFAQAGAEPTHHLLYADGMERFCVAATVYAPGQAGPVARHDFWEICGVLEGAATRARFVQDGAGEPARKGAEKRLSAGAVDTVFSRDRAAVAEAADGGGAAIVLRVYGGDPGKGGRVSLSAEGEAPAPIVWANAEGWPPYDIFSIQTEIRD